MRRIRPRFQPLLDAFASVEMDHPIHTALLVGITDDQPQGFLEEVKNNDGFFQVIAGCPSGRTEEELAHDVFNILESAVRLCPFSEPDHKRFNSLFQRMRSTVLDAD